MYVVIGATGNTGSIVANKLANQGKNVRVVGRNAEHLAQFKKAEPFVGDVTDNTVMENTLGQADAIKGMGSAAGPLRPELKIPMIATRDIGAFAADALSRLEFAGQQVQELHGQRDLSFGEITSILGKAIGKRDLNYV